MAELIIKSTVQDGIMQIKLDGKIVMRQNESKTIKIADDKEYIIQWFVKGSPGTTYGIKITSPDEAKIDLVRTLKNSGKDFGGFRFKA